MSWGIEDGRLQSASNKQKDFVVSFPTTSYIKSSSTQTTTGTQLYLDRLSQVEKILEAYRWLQTLKHGMLQGKLRRDDFTQCGQRWITEQSGVGNRCVRLGHNFVPFFLSITWTRYGENKSVKHSLTFNLETGLRTDRRKNCGGTVTILQNTSTTLKFCCSLPITSETNSTTRWL